MTGGADDRPKSILEDTIEGDPALADSVVEPIDGVGILCAQLDQFPHQLVSFVHRQLIPGGYTRVYTVIAKVVDFRFHINLGAIVVGDGDAHVSLFHVHFLPFCSLLEHLYNSIDYNKLQ